MSDRARAALRVPLERLQRREPVREWRASVPAAALSEDGQPLRIADVTVPPDREVAVDVVLDQVSEGVMVSGAVTCTWVGECARCLRDVDGESVAQVGELFEVSPTDGESYELGHEWVDLEPLVRDAVLLELPIEAVRCPFPDPCPHAPEELSAQPDDDTGNAGAEDDTGLADPRWAALDELRFDGDTGQDADDRGDRDRAD